MNKKLADTAIAYITASNEIKRLEKELKQLEKQKIALYKKLYKFKEFEHSTEMDDYVVTMVQGH